jgi:hypothetical protein
MPKQRVRFTFPPDRITEPIIYLLGKDFNVVTNIRRADVTDSTGWVVLEVEGSVEDIQRGLAWVKDRGVRVDPVGGDVVAG